MKFILPPKYIEENLVRVQKHPTLPLRIYNYTEHCQFSKAWDDITLQCRGLIVDEDDEIVARPFKKFFNYEEHVGQGKPFPEGTPEVIEKMDGSLGIIFFYADEWHVATRGSFTSEQAIHAKERLRSINLPVGSTAQFTHLVEIIYPSNRIVCDYKGQDVLAYLGSIHTASGAEDATLLLSHDAFIHPRIVNEEFISYHFKLDSSNLGQLGNYFSKIATGIQEGFVLKWPNGFRLKIKFEEYKRLHKLLTCTNERTIWEAMKNGEDLEKIIESVPDEFFEWVQKTCEELGKRYNFILETSLIMFAQLKGMNRKEFAEEVKTLEHPAIFFNLFDKKHDNVSDYIWKIIRPEATKPFKVEI